ncbi:MAG TPA: rubrerythrin family protein [Candidatus Saccharimonadales bacterium]|nr:rubrerythrin family protein [Candidatus Saccharimonadales bacterium]
MPLHEKTKENLITAMHGEAFAYAKYVAFAEHARKNGNPDLAILFEETAKVEFFEHFAEEAQLAGLVGTDIENLQDAIAGENYEVETMYKEFAEAALTAGDSDAAARFVEVRRDEAKHRAAFRSMLERMLTARV